MNKDITLEDLGYEEIEPFGIFKKTYRKLDEIVENEEELKEVEQLEKLDEMENNNQDENI